MHHDQEIAPRLALFLPTLMRTSVKSSPTRWKKGNGGKEGVITVEDGSLWQMSLMLLVCSLTVVYLSRLT